MGLQILWVVFAILGCGVLVWGIDQIPAIDPTFKQFAKVVLIVLLAFYVLYTLFMLVAGHVPAMK